MTPQSLVNQSPNRTVTTATLNTSLLLHDLILTGLTAASIFVKNPASQEKAGVLINLINSILKEHGQQL